MNWSSEQWQDALTNFVALIISLTVHEAAHAWVALLGGDRTAARSGQVTLNPIPHIRREPFGMIALPALTLYLSGGRYCMGFAHAPFDPIWAWHHPRKAALMAAAGPMANLLLATIAFWVMVWVGVPVSDSGYAVRDIAEAFLVLNVILFLFNLLPIPPLDGASVLEGLVVPLRRFFDFLRGLHGIGIVAMVAGSYLVQMAMEPILTLISGWLRALR